MPFLCKLCFRTLGMRNKRHLTLAKLESLATAGVFLFHHTRCSWETGDKSAAYRKIQVATAIWFPKWSSEKFSQLRLRATRMLVGEVRHRICWHKSSMRLALAKPKVSFVTGRWTSPWKRPISKSLHVLTLDPFTKINFQQVTTLKPLLFWDSTQRWPDLQFVKFAIQNVQNGFKSARLR